jgi:hypothetical protein
MPSVRKQTNEGNDAEVICTRRISLVPRNTIEQQMSGRASSTAYGQLLRRA